MTYSPVYLIDDDEAALASTEFLLTALGIQARSFSDPYAFLHAVSSLTPGCILTDLRMPAMSGLELHASLVKKGIGWPVILMSGHSAIETNLGALAGGMPLYKYVAKGRWRRRYILKPRGKAVCRCTNG